MLRGRPEGPAAAAATVAWAAKVPSKYAEYLRAQRSRDPQALTQAETEMDALRREGATAELYVQWLAVGPALADVTFLTVLCKQDQAEARWRRNPKADHPPLAKDRGRSSREASRRQPQKSGLKTKPLF